ncbi:MAG: DUF4912 domain-containing protein [Elusimicrobiales bacterium]|jgi:hypothetical protein|nr:DUF4912 domain-containing protein [Elusimicrobiales bacterium]
MTSSGNIKPGSTQPDSAHRALPEGYGETEAVLLPRDPNWMYLYWEITEHTRGEARKAHGDNIFDTSLQVVRVYDMSGAEGANGGAHHKYFDIPVRLEARSWYVNVQESGRSYCCELGLVLPDGRFVGLVKTNAVKLPAGRVSDVTDEKWMAVSGDFEKLLQLSGVEYIGKGSGEVAKSLAQRWEMLRSVFSRAASWGVSSLSSHQQPKPAEKKFWLVADCELILYGATEPDASVTLAGRKVHLNPDGTFSMRFALPDGNMDLPVAATSADGSDTRSIEIKVTRSTLKDGK